MRSDLPTGTVTFLFTDIEGSTQLLQSLREDYARVLVEHHQLLREAFDAHNGVVVDTQGDSFFVAFSRATDAMHSTVEAQRALAAHHWTAGAQIRVRMGLHTGEPTIAGEHYVGIDLHRAARIGAAGHGGQVLLSQTTHALVQGELPDGVTLRDMREHRLKDLRAREHLYQIVIAGHASDFPPLRTLDVVPNNLPLQLTSFIGREKEIGEIKEILGRSRLLTLTGTGGSGKTRLALEVAAEVLDLERFKHGIWFGDLGPLSDASLVPQTVATTLGVREEPGRPISNSLMDYLEDKTLLLILDNCEQVIEACALLADSLLHGCPRLKILATSREALGIAGEIAHRVPPLFLPSPMTLSRPVMSADTLSQYEAVRLFIERAVTIQPHFVVTNQNAPALAQICYRLDGIPLALELAAARVKVLSVEQISQKLDDRFRLLTGGSRTALPRQKTLRAAIDWSYDLLSEPERGLLRRLAVFASGWTLDATENICQRDTLQSDDVLDLLTHLVDKSLVLVDEQKGESRYRMLETIRQYAVEKLTESGEAEDIAARHLKLFLQLAEQAEPHLFGPEQGWWFQRLELERDNLRAALSWSEYGEAGREQGLRLAGALWRFWYTRSYLHEGKRWLEAALEQDEHAHPAARAKALNGLGMLAFAQGDYKAAQVVLSESVELYKQVGDKWGTSFALTNLGLQFYSQREFIKAVSLLEASLVHARELGDKVLIALALNGLGEVARYQADDERARALYEESLVLAREGGDKERILEPLFNLGAVAHQQGNDELAFSLFKEGLMQSQLVGIKRLLVAYLGGLAGVWGARGEAQRSGRLFGAAERLREDTHYQLEGVDLTVYEADAARTRAALGEDAFQQAWAQGRTMTLEQATALALNENESSDDES